MAASDRPSSHEGVRDRERRFVLALVGPARMNVTLAWHIANAGRRPVSNGQARKAATKALMRPRVSQAVEAELAKQHKRLEITADRTMNAAAALAYTNIDDVMTWDERGVHLTPSAQLSPRARAAIQQIEVTEQRIGEGENTIVTRKVKLRMHSKVPALELLMRHFNLLDADMGRRELPPFGGLVIVQPGPGAQVSINGGSGNGHASSNGGHGNGHGRVVTLGPYEATVDDGSVEGEEAGDAAGVADPEADGEGEGR